MLSITNNVSITAKPNFVIMLLNLFDKAPDPMVFVPELQLTKEDLMIDKEEIAYFRTKVNRYDPCWLLFK